MKLNLTSKFTSASLIAVGSAGTAFCLSAPYEGFPTDGTPATASFRSAKVGGFSFVEIGSLHGKGEASGFPEWDACLFVSPRGETVRVMPLSAALKSGVVRADKYLLRGLGPEREVTCYVPASHKPGMRPLKFTASPDVPAGRIESKLVFPDKRNESYVGHLLPVALKAAKPAAPAKSPAKSPAPAAKPSTKK